MTTRFAVLIDGDNVGAQHLDQIRRSACARGQVDIWRTYADASLRKDWDAQPGVRLIHAGTGKNAADILLSIDAMVLAFRDDVGGFVIVSSDGDFSHVASRLRELGRPVIGMGEAKTPAVFRAACTEFEVIGNPKPMHCVTDLDRQIRTTIAQHSKNGQGMRLAELAAKMYSSHGVRISSLPEKRWRSYLITRVSLYDVDPKGAAAKVRFKPAGFVV
ncbi:NYN domain-containing protein [Roseovarius aestuariivivens]|uniref:NYN domain-containing protein n=1 Tax=Roseovarius aestuariivivens TaxID=1888910 RepID=UPI00108030DD|nr:NYN domain-containing protein [Roseovarius aestuariivivens]